LSCEERVVTIEFQGMNAREAFAVTLPEVDPICVVIARTRHGMIQAEIREAAKQGARLIELRLDFLKKPPDFQRLLADKPCPMIATVRRPPEGGKWDGSEDARKTLIRQAIVADFDWVDLETDIADGIPRFGRVRRIVSYHNFQEMPADLEKIHARMCAQDADVVKVAVRARQAADNLRVLALVRKGPKPTVAFCMGENGVPSRILQAKYGAPFTYAAFNKDRFGGLGIPSLRELDQVYHYRSLNADTEVFGVVGDPVGHSLSPLIHNAAFRALGLNAVYLPFRVPRDTLLEFLRLFDPVPVKGYSVTIPHKEAAAVVAGHQDETVERCKAANTLVRTPEGFNAFNTDYNGILDTIEEFLAGVSHQESLGPVEPMAPAGQLGMHRPPESPGAPPPVVVSGSGSVAGRVALILGSGGVARAAAHALHHKGAMVVITGRTGDRAHALATEVGCRHVEWNARHSVLCELVLNCTSVGMHPQVDESPLHHSFLRPGLVVFDAVYTPEQTLLVKEARERGCQVVTGVEMFIRQAALQFEHFTARPAPIDLFRKVVRRALSPVTLRDDEGAGA
jgi:3-dehydroquinate dehydratase/shikimate dehydrogenase